MPPRRATSRQERTAIPDVEDCYLPPPSNVKDLQRSLLRWYEDQRRDLPWREPLTRAVCSHVAARDSAPVVNQSRSQAPSVRNKSSLISVNVEMAIPDDDSHRNTTPYAIWVSEVMSQQTQIATMVPYWRRWMQRFPTVAALAAASVDDVVAAWAGLGYYRRAKLLSAGARYVRDHCGGEVPSTYEELIKVPGIGPYTAGAIASIAFGREVAAVDGNVIRVVTRLRGALNVDPKSKDALLAAKAVAASLVVGVTETVNEGQRGGSQRNDKPAAGAAAGCFNQALMELGATVCRGNAEPDCGVCPLREHCRAFTMLTAGELGATGGDRQTAGILGRIPLSGGRGKTTPSGDGKKTSRKTSCPESTNSRKKIDKKVRIEHRIVYVVRRATPRTDVTSAAPTRRTRVPATTGGGSRKRPRSVGDDANDHGDDENTGTYATRQGGALECFMIQRPFSDSLYGGLWDFPMSPCFHQKPLTRGCVDGRRGDANAKALHQFATRTAKASLESAFQGHLAVAAEVKSSDTVVHPLCLGDSGVVQHRLSHIQYYLWLHVCDVASPIGSALGLEEPIQRRRVRRVSPPASPLSFPSPAVLEPIRGTKWVPLITEALTVGGSSLASKVMRAAAAKMWRR